MVWPEHHPWVGWLGNDSDAIQTAKTTQIIVSGESKLLITLNHFFFFLENQTEIVVVKDIEKNLLPIFGFLSEFINTNSIDKPSIIISLCSCP